MARRNILRFLATGLALAGLAGCGQMPVSTGLAAAGAPTASPPLLGSTPEVLQAEFGQPALLRVDGPAQVWLYHSSVCGLDLILYPDRSGTPRVATAVPDNGDAASCALSLVHGVTTAALERPAAS